MRYEIRAVADETCDSVREEVLASTDDAGEAKRMAAELSAGEVYGTAIVDTRTGEMDFGA